jgi:hypothetical protein
MGETMFESMNLKDGDSDKRPIRTGVQHALGAVREDENGYIPA